MTEPAASPCPGCAAIRTELDGVRDALTELARQLQRDAGESVDPGYRDALLVQKRRASLRVVHG